MKTEATSFWGGNLLSERRFLVTGASSGIGANAAHALSALGAKVILFGRDDSRLKAVLGRLDGEGHASYSFDLSAADEIPDLLLNIARQHGPLNGFLHAAGISTVRSIGVFKPSSFDATFSASVRAGLALARGFCQKGVQSADGWSSLCFMSSVSAVRGQSGLSVYAASKGAIEALTRSLAVELADRRVRVNSVLAGAIVTEMHSRLTNNLPDQAIKDYESRHLLGFGSPTDISNAAIYLLSDVSRWVTGTSLVVDGGYTCR
jgi:NAD(P)-dependent dehydrogenase (short-subunit alcohol dehydrogenase family)